MEEIGKIREKLKRERKIKDFPASKSDNFEEAEKNIEIDESDIPVHEKLVKEEKIKEIKKNKRNLI